MSNAFAIAAVTAVLKDLLNDGLINHDLSAQIGNVQVTALPPDLVQFSNPDEASRLNLFLYQVTPNPGWRNANLPSRNGDGLRLTNPPLALDLHYLLTAYSAQELHAEVLIGYAMQLLHETPFLSREAINKTLKPPLPAEITLPPALKMLVTSDLAEQVESIKICPQYLSVDEMSKVWSSIQKPYRPSVAYQVSVVLIQATRPTRSPIPVLSIGKENQGVQVQPDVARPVPPYPTIQSIELPRRQTEAMPGDTLTIRGHHLLGDVIDPAQVEATVRITHRCLESPIDLPVQPGGPLQFTNTTLQVKLAGSPAGICTLALVITYKDPMQGKQRTNDFPLAIAPRILAVEQQPLTAGLPSVARPDVQDELGDLTLHLACEPQVLPDQRVELFLGDQPVPAEPRTDATAELAFTAKDMRAGTFRLRLRVDGVDSLLIDRSDERQPVFDDSQQVQVT